MADKRTGSRIETHLSEEQIETAREFARQIDVRNRNEILQYGSKVQKKNMAFSQSSILALPLNDLKEIIEDIGKLEGKLKIFQTELQKSMKNMAEADQLKQFRHVYDPFSEAMIECARRLAIHQSSLGRHMKRLDDLADKCMDLVREFDMYIYAGEVCLKNGRSTELVRLVKAAEASGLMEDTIIADDYSRSCALFDQKLDSLCVSRALPVQTISHIRLVQNRDILLEESLRKLCADTFPLYRNRVIMAAGSAVQQIDGKLIAEACADLQRSLDAVITMISREITGEKENIRKMGKK